MSGQMEIILSEQEETRLIDWPVLNYEITKAEYGKWKTYGEMNAPIIVNLTGEKSDK